MEHPFSFAFGRIGATYSRKLGRKQWKAGEEEENGS